ncbi:hypothetical protein [Nocardia sp. NPDC006630]|uniref:hypothetical protein n=1 Tax=Nocardia sp. NPDC006630 TaxID=3157181 RepID=UPI0033AEAAA8
MAHTLTRTLAALAAATCLATTAAATATAVPSEQATGTIESGYSAPGPWQVTAQHAFACCDTTGAAYDVWYPTDLGAKGFRHPIITWGDGTLALPHQYTYLLQHLASWGFVVIAPENEATGTGADITAAANYLVQQNSTPASIFFQKLNPGEIGAVGHSQGAVGALNAMINSGGAIKTAVPIELPIQLSCLPGICADTRRIGAGSVFFVNGAQDSVISPSTQAQPWQTSGLQSDQAYYEATPETVAKAWATVNDANHNDVQGQPDCAAASFPCVRGVYSYLGYPTAWLLDQLTGDARAHSVFVSGTGELFDQNASWSNPISNITS